MEKTQLKKAMTYLVILGLALFSALNYQIFVFPNKFAPSGLGGICTMIQYVSGVSVGYLSLLVNIPLAMIAWKKVGVSFSARSMTYVVTFSLALILFGNMDLSAFAYETANGTSKILGPLVAGIINGACISTLIRCSGSSGGIDFIAALIRRVRPEQNFFWITFSINVCIAFVSYFVYGFEIEPVILCILYSFMSSMVSDSVMKSGRSAVRCEIVTESGEALSGEIIQKLHHTTTLLPGTGMYLGQPTDVLVCILSKGELPMLSEIIENYPDTFVVLSPVSDVLGNFKRRDARGNLKKEIFDKGDGGVA